MKIKELHPDIERYLLHDCYCPHEIYSFDGFGYQLFYEDQECEKLGEAHLEDTGIEQEEFKESLQFEVAETGFRFGNPGKMYYVPCYSSQNGYYTTEVDIYYNGECVCNTDGEWIDE